MVWSIQKPDDWQQYKNEIFNLYYDEKWSRKKVSQHMRMEYGLKATERQYKRLLSTSGRSKNLTASTWVNIGGELRRREQQGKNSEVVWDGQVIGAQRLTRELERYKQRLSRINIRDVCATKLSINTPPATSPGAVNTIGTGDIGTNLRDDEHSSLCVPSDVMSEHDYGSIGVITRQLLIHNISTFGRGNIDLSEIAIFANSHLPKSETRSPSGTTMQGALQRTISRYPDYSWTWESLATILASETMRHEWQYIPGFPATTVDLTSCSKTDLLNMAMNVFTNRNFILTSFLIPMVNWFLDERQHQLLTLMFGFQSAGSLPFAMALLAIVADNMPYGLTPRTPSRDITHLMRPVFEAIKKKYLGRVSKLEATKLLSVVASFKVPDLVANLIRQGASLDNEDSLDDLLSSKMPLTQAIRSGNPEVAMLLLDSGANPTNAIFSAIKADLKVKNAGPGCNAFLPTLASYGADVDLWNFETSPFTYAEFYAFQSPVLGQRLLPAIRNARTRELIQWLNQKPLACELMSPSARELALLGAIRFKNLDSAIRLLRSGISPNCPSLTETLSSRAQAGSYRATCCAINMSSYTGHCLPICYAFRYHNIYILRQLLEAGAVLPCPMSYMSFDDKRDLDLMQKLTPMILKLQLQLTGRIGHHLLNLAAMNQDFNTITTLMSMGVQLSGRWDTGDFERHQKTQTHLIFALQKCSISVVKHFWVLGAGFIHEPPYAGASELNSLFNTWFDADARDNHEKFSFLMDKGASVIAPCDEDNERLSPLQSFLRSMKQQPPDQNYIGVLNIVKTLVMKGACVNAEDSTAPTPLQFALDTGCFDIMKYLIDRGAHVNLARGCRASPLGIACERRRFWSWKATGKFRSKFSVIDKKQSEIVEFLIRRGANVNLEQGHRPIALAAACQSGRVEIVHLLLDHGAKVELKSGDIFESEKLTPLQHVCGSPYFNAVTMARCLIENGADVNAPPGALTALQWASLRGHFHLTLLLLEAGADVNAPSGDPSAHRVCGTAVELAAFAGSYDVVKLLINAGAEGDVKHGRFSKAIDLAIRRSHFHVAELLKISAGLSGP